jgi:hypothetical protein
VGAVWNRTRAKSEVLRADGANVADTSVAAIEASDVVFVNVSDYEPGEDKPYKRPLPLLCNEERVLRSRAEGAGGPKG